VCCGFLSPLKSIALAGFEPATFGSSGKHTNHYTTKATTNMVLNDKIIEKVCSVSYVDDDILLTRQGCKQEIKLIFSHMCGTVHGNLRQNTTSQLKSYKVISVLF
jgi:hypothetical protein